MAKKGLKNKIWLLVFIVLNVAVLFYLISKDKELTAPLTDIIRFNFVLILAAVILIFVYLFLDIGMYNYVIKMFTNESKYKSSVKISILGKYYDAITPFGSGGQPFQIYYLTKAGLSAGHASCVILVKYLIYQICFCFYGLLALIFTSSQMIAMNPAYFAIAILGIIINIAMPVSIYLLTYKSSRFTKIYMFFINIGVKLKLVKNKDKAVSYIDNVVTPFVGALKIMRENRWKTAYIFLITFIQITAFISIPYVIYLSTSPVNIASWFDFVFLYLFVYFVVTIFPLPGGTGAAEIGFSWVFASFFTTEATLPLSVLLWRSISFYLPLFLGFGIILVEAVKSWYKNKQFKLPDLTKDLDELERKSEKKQIE